MSGLMPDLSAWDAQLATHATPPLVVVVCVLAVLLLVMGLRDLRS